MRDKTSIGLAGLVLAAACTATPVLAQVDPEHAESWEFMQQSMPGISSELLKAACEEGSLMIYHGSWAAPQENQIEHFKERFPCIEVETFGATVGVLRERFLSEVRAGRFIADIIQDTDPGSLNAEAAEGLLMEYTISNDGSYDEAVKLTGYWYPLRIGIITIVWNTDLVSEEEAKLLSDWKSVINPIWKGRMAVQNPSSGGAAYSPWYAWTELYGDDFIKEIGAQEPRIFTGMNPAGAALAAGDVAVMFGASETPLPQLWEQGAPIRWSMPEPGVGPISGQAIAAEAPHPNAAKLYQEYSFTLEGYGYWQELGGPPTRIDYTDKRKVAAEPWYQFPKIFFEYDPDEATNAMGGIQELFDQWVGVSR